MKAFAYWLVLGLLVGIATTGSGIVGALFGIGFWWLSVQIWWRTWCPRCDGSPRKFEPGSDTTWRPCAVCSGRGWVPRAFAVGRNG